MIPLFFDGIKIVAQILISLRMILAVSWIFAFILGASIAHFFSF